jgi:6-phosphogluconolactonase
LFASGSCHIGLTGGRSAKHLYREWSLLPDFYTLSNVFFYFGDERCVAADSEESNYGLVMRTLFHKGVPEGCIVFPINTSEADCDKSAKDYESMLPSHFDILLLSVGDDGHIASIFPGENSLYETKRKILPVLSKKAPHQRITITPTILSDVNCIFVLAIGDKKAAILNKLIDTSNREYDVPARLVLSGTWLLSTPLDSLS